MAYFSFAAFSKISELYIWLNALSEDCDVVECGQLHRGAYTAFVLSPVPLAKPIICADFFTFKDSGERFLKAYHKQNAFSVQQGLLVVECEKLSEMCAIVLANPEFKDFQLLEVSRNALPGGMASAIFVNVNNFKYPDNFSGAYIAQLNPQIRKLF